ncbi:hypothetical protein Tco_0181488, partial [Tanacetum coccineum]
EVAQQGKAPPLSSAYVPYPIKLDEHVPVYVLEPKHLKHHVPSDDDIQVEDRPYAEDASPAAESPGYIADSYLIEEDTDEDSIDYLDEPEDEDKYPEEDDEEDPEEDPSKEHEPEDEDSEEEEPSEGSDETKPFEEDETATPIAASTQALIDAFSTGSPPFPLPPTSPTYDLVPLGHRAARIRMRDDIPEENMPPRRRFVLTAPPTGCDIAESSATAARPPRGRYDSIDTIEA